MSSVHAERDLSKTKPQNASLILSCSYVLFCSCYIFLSSHLAYQFSKNVQIYKQIEMYKGISFILVTGIALFLFSRLLFNRIVRQQRHILEQQAIIAAAERRALGGTFAVSIAHDINNLLSIVDFDISELRENSSSKLPLESVNRLETIFNRIESLSQNLMRIARQKITTDLSTINLNELIQNTISLLRSHTRVRSCKLVFDSEQDLSISSNPHVLEQCLINLIINSADATSGQGAIEVKTFSKDDSVLLEVHDNGPGISKEQQKILFVPFYTTKESGNGLGLASIKASLELLNGTIAYEDSPSGGSLFKITLTKK